MEKLEYNYIMWLFNMLTCYYFGFRYFFILLLGQKTFSHKNKYLLISLLFQLSYIIFGFIDTFYFIFSFLSLECILKYDKIITFISELDQQMEQFKNLTELCKNIDKKELGAVVKFGQVDSKGEEKIEYFVKKYNNWKKNMLKIKQNYSSQNKLIVDKFISFDCKYNLSNYVSQLNNLFAFLFLFIKNLIFRLPFFGPFLKSKLEKIVELYSYYNIFINIENELKIDNKSINLNNNLVNLEPDFDNFDNFNNLLQLNDPNINKFNFMKLNDPNINNFNFVDLNDPNINNMMASMDILNKMVEDIKKMDNNFPKLRTRKN
ncbi:Hypothetical protein KVN_LOCUS498 [uncultured virus]|nr:Hypothetical protein KVN_LOCUS498 [uncultured virus]